MRLLWSAISFWVPTVGVPGVTSVSGVRLRHAKVSACMSKAWGGAQRDRLGSVVSTLAVYELRVAVASISTE